MENVHFNQLIGRLQIDNCYQKAMDEAHQKYLVKIYKVAELKPEKIKELYFTLRKKFYLNKSAANEETWFENELRIFIWLVIGYLYIHGKELLQLTDPDWNYFSLIFNERHTSFFQYQIRCLLKNINKSPKWAKDQIYILKQIINAKLHQNKWNSIARELFIRSNKLYYRNPKQCRERWINHQDPTKKHCEWSRKEDLKLLQCIKANGKKWSAAVRILAHTRTEHMVKNRYKSLIANELKSYPHKRAFQLQNLIIKRLQKELEFQKLQTINNCHNSCSKSIGFQEISKKNEFKQTCQIPKTVINKMKNECKQQQMHFIDVCHQKFRECTKHSIELQEQNEESDNIFEQEEYEKDQIQNLHLMQEDHEYFLKSPQFATLKPPNLNYQLLMQNLSDRQCTNKSQAGYFLDEGDEGFL